MLIEIKTRQNARIVRKADGCRSACRLVPGPGDKVGSIVAFIGSRTAAVSPMHNREARWDLTAHYSGARTVLFDNRFDRFPVFSGAVQNIFQKLQTFLHFIQFID